MNSFFDFKVFWRYAVVLILAGITLWLALTGREASENSEAGVNIDLPYHIGSFWGVDDPISLSEKVILPPDTQFAKKAYQNYLGQTINCEIVLSGAEKRSIHRPEICLPGQGWSIQSGEVVPVALANNRTLSVMKLTLTRSHEEKLKGGKSVTLYFLYWFVGEDKTTPYHWERILLTSWDRIVHHINHRWAYVIVSTLVVGDRSSQNDNSQAAMKLLENFIQTIVPAVIKEGVQTR